MTLPTLCVLTLFRNEVVTIVEWIDHYRYFGVNHFFLGDDNSTDCSRAIAQSQRAIVDDITIVSIPQRHSQIPFYESMNATVNEFDFALIVDLDEFVYPRFGFRTLRHYLATIHASVSQVLVNMKMFGSSGYIKQPVAIRTSFIHRQASYSRLTKAFVRPQRVLSYGIHRTQVKGTTISENELVHLNHYRIMSLEYFQTVKMTRGDAHKQSFDTLRNMTHFSNDDKNATVVDLELANMVLGSRHSTR
jgi:hypothetical protein